MSINKRVSIVLITFLFTTSLIFAQNTIQSDSVNIAIEHLIKQNDELIKLNMSPKLSEEEKGIQSLVYTMHDSWKNITESKDPNDIIKYFQTNFIVNFIEVDVNNEGHVSRFTKDNFKDFVKKLIKANSETTLKFGSIIFLDIEIKDNLYFNVIYKSIIDKYKDDIQISTRTSFVTITGRKIEGNWKIANYSWVSFESIP